MKNRWQVTGVIVKKRRGSGVLLTESDLLDHRRL